VSFYWIFGQRNAELKEGVWTLRERQKPMPFVKSLYRRNLNCIERKYIHIYQFTKTPTQQHGFTNSSYMNHEQMCLNTHHLPLVMQTDLIPLPVLYILSTENCSRIIRQAYQWGYKRTENDHSSTAYKTASWLLALPHQGFVIFCV